MKKVICVLLSALFILSLAGCAGGTSDITTAPADGAGETKTDNPADTTAGKTDVANETEKPTDKKVLVAYYSATGSTRAVAQMIADSLNADIFEIVPEKPYTSADLKWSDSDSRVSTEHNDESKRNVPLAKAVPDDWSSYDTVFIGYPIWWGIAAWPVNGFISANDFNGKKVIPFCTSASSGLGSSAELLKTAAGAGEWLEGKRFSSGVSESEVAEWLDGLSVK